ncbi:alpha/beta hydrolase [Psychrobacter urativorans]|uniref:alpha/beta hydrolase n=1 Tax=Psychrobacter urativorans TaxID=45610 RepID=UPI0019199D44|nr:alpha/beta hydrolase [Psychrobacter urativorans]
MPILPIPSLQALVTKVVKTTAPEAAKPNNRQHLLHYLLKGLGQLPTPLLERLNHSLNAPTAKQYPHADAHLRLIIALNSKLKRPLQLNQLIKLRHKFATDAVALQAPKVWQQPDAGIDIETNTDVKSKTKKSALSKGLIVSWKDKNIANADGGDMTIRCYQEQDSNQQNPNKHNTDKIAMLFFHGGGFCIGDVDTHHEFCHAVCAKTGWVVVSVDYRLAPEHSAPTALRDCLTAYKWLAEHCYTLDVLPSRIVLSGDSAGGCLAILVAQQVTAPNVTQWLDSGLDAETTTNLLQDLPPPLAQLPLYPVTDIEADYPSWGLYGQGLLLDHDDIEVFDAAYMQHSFLTRSHALISPMHGNNTNMCPSYIVAAELDILRDEALAYAAQLQEDDIESQTHTVLGAPHGFIHLMSVHQGLGRKIDYIINEFADFVLQIIDTEANSIPSE